MFEKITSRVSQITPLLLKVEEILVFTRTRRSPRLASYYHHWEMKLFNAIGMVMFFFCHTSFELMIAEK